MVQRNYFIQYVGLLRHQYTAAIISCSLYFWEIGQNENAFSAAPSHGPCGAGEDGRQARACGGDHQHQDGQHRDAHGHGDWSRHLGWDEAESDGGCLGGGGAEARAIGKNRRKHSSERHAFREYNTSDEICWRNIEFDEHRKYVGYLRGQDHCEDHDREDSFYKGLTAITISFVEKQQRVKGEGIMSE